MAQIYVPDNPREREQLEQPSRMSTVEQRTHVGKQKKRRYGIVDALVVLALSTTTGGAIAFTGKCAGSISTRPFGVANHKCPSCVRHAEGWLFVAVSRLRSSSAGPNSIQWVQSAVIEQLHRAIPWAVANHR